MQVESISNMRCISHVILVYKPAQYDHDKALASRLATDFHHANSYRNSMVCPSVRVASVYEAQHPTP